MARKNAVINFATCFPHTCDRIHGKCQALDACNKKLLEQEDPFDQPILMSEAMCHGCGACKKACPLHAIDIV
jgi:translation initiation factor RLI1